MKKKKKKQEIFIILKVSNFNYLECEKEKLNKEIEKGI